MFTTGLKEFKEFNKNTTSAVDEALLQTRKTIVKYKIAILIESKQVHNKKQARLEMHYDFSHEDIINEIESDFVMVKHI